MPCSEHIQKKISPAPLRAERVFIVACHSCLRSAGTLSCHCRLLQIGADLAVNWVNWCVSVPGCVYATASPREVIARERKPRKYLFLPADFISRPACVSVLEVLLSLFMSQALCLRLYVSIPGPVSMSLFPSQALCVRLC